MEDQTPELASLPPEIWTMVFRHLGPFCLSRVRLTCRTWNRIVCNSRALMDNFCIQLDNKSFVEGAENVRSLVTGSSDGGGGFTRARFREVTLIIPELVGAFWAPMAANLHTLSIVKCMFRFSFVVQLLEQTRNLRFLCYYDLEPRASLEDVRCSFQLVGMRHLRLMLRGNGLDAQILRIFREMCPRLEVLDVEPKQWEQLCAEFCHETVSFVKTTRGTLKELTIYSTKDMIEHLANVDGLSLTRLKLEIDTSLNREIFLFIKAQESHLECLTFVSKDDCGVKLDLHKEGCAFPKLTNLQINFWDFDMEFRDANFLHFIPKLEILQIQEIDFSAMKEKLPNMIELTLKNGIFEYFEDIIKWCPNVRKIHLYDISIPYLKDILELVHQSENIEDLTLTEIFEPEIVNGLHFLQRQTGDFSLTSDDLDLELDTVSFETHGSIKLRILNLQSDIPNQLLRSMLMVYPNLAELYLNYDPKCDSIFFTICRRLPRLEILGLCSCRKCIKGRVTESPRPSELLVISCVRDEWRKVDFMLKVWAVKELRFVPCNYLKQDDYLLVDSMKPWI